MKKFILFALSSAVCLNSAAVVPHKANIPDIPGYVTLKGDFHIHTVFSDGKIWPTTRVEEAYYDGLDFISITDHIDTRHRKMVKKGYFNKEKCTGNTAFEMASDFAGQYGISVIPGGEITRGLRLFPGHFNAHFVQDCDKLTSQMEKDDDNIKDPVLREERAIMNGLKEAREQGAFLVWNHPNWEPQEPNEVIWHSIQEEAFKAGLMDGIEIVNQHVAYSPEAFHMAMTRNLTIVSGTDSHESISTITDYEGGEFRSMTLVFAKEKSAKGIREALDNHRTAVFYDGSIYGKEEFIRPLLDACVKMSKLKITDNTVTLVIENVSSIPICLRKAPGSETLVMKRNMTINPGEIYIMKINAVKGAKHFEYNDFEVNYFVDNFQTDANTPLLVSYKVSVPKKTSR